MSTNRSTEGFPPPSPDIHQVTWADLCNMVDASEDVQVVYTFGGNVPSSKSTLQGIPASVPHGYARAFVEFRPYAFLET